MLGNNPHDIYFMLRGMLGNAPHDVSFIRGMLGNAPHGAFFGITSQVYFDPIVLISIVACKSESLKQMQGIG